MEDPRKSRSVHISSHCGESPVLRFTGIKTFFLLPTKSERWGQQHLEQQTKSSRRTCKKPRPDSLEHRSSRERSGMALKRSRLGCIIEDRRVIDLCSPCSAELNTSKTPATESFQPALHNPVNLFEIDEQVNVSLQDEYWEPEEYRTERIDEQQLRSDSDKSDVDENTAPSNSAVDTAGIIDLCSPGSSNESEESTSLHIRKVRVAEVTRHTEKVVQRAASQAHDAVDLTQGSQGSGSWNESEYVSLGGTEKSVTRNDTCQTHSNTGHGSRQATITTARVETSRTTSVSLFSRVTAAPSLRTLSEIATISSSSSYGGESGGGGQGVPRSGRSLFQILHAPDIRPSSQQQQQRERIPTAPVPAIATAQLRRPSSQVMRTTIVTAEDDADSNHSARSAAHSSWAPLTAGPLPVPPLRKAASTGQARKSKAAVLSSSHTLPLSAPIASSVTGPSAAAPTSAAPVESALRSRFAEKTLVTLPPLQNSAEYEVMMLIDMRERCNARIQSSMAAYGIPCRLSTLAVGDFLWVIRPRAVGASAGLNASSSGAGAAVRGVGAPLCQRSTAVTCEDDGEDTRASNTMDAEPEDEGDETFDPHAAYVLDCVAERKSINDLVSSFGDGRYTEQKNRLKACSLRSTMYIVEGEHIVVSMHQKAISATHVKTAMVSIHVDSGMHVLRTRSLDHTITCLRNLHKQVERRFLREHSPSSVYQPFKEFQSMYRKKAALGTMRQLFGHQLRQVQGCSTSVAATLMNKYGTTARFMQELDCMGMAKAEYTLTNTVNEVTQRKLGPALAKRLCQVFLTEY